MQCRKQNGLVSSLAVEKKCADPVVVDLGVGRDSKQFTVGGDGLGSMETIGDTKVRVDYGRNATHLHFKV